MTDRRLARRLAAESIAAGEPTAWFERLYASGGIVPWADLVPNPYLPRLLEDAPAGRALDVGCGLGDNAAFLVARGYDVVAFDVSPTAVAEARARFPDLPVEWRSADLLAIPDEWHGRFDLVVEIFTLQVLPAAVRERAARGLVDAIAPGGTLRLCCRLREPHEPVGEMPWPLTEDEVRTLFRNLEVLRLERVVDATEDPPVRRLLGVFRRAA